MSDKVRMAVKATRKSYLISVAVVAVVAGLIACQDGVRNSFDVGAPEQSSAVKSPGSAKNRFAYVGEEHNAEVDYVLREFAKKWKKNMKRADVCASLNAITHKYLASKGKSSEVARFYAPNDPCNDDKKVVPSEKSSKASVATASYAEDVSQRAMDLANEVQSIMLISSSSADVASRLDPIVAEANSMGPEDAALVLGVSAIAQSSAAYWEANLTTWVITYSQDGSQGALPFLRVDTNNGVGSAMPRRPMSWWTGVGEVGWADVGGGIVGGIRGAFGGPGGILIGIGSGAAYSSIGAAIGQIIHVIQ